ncbi:MAG: hypothetical protein AB8G99_23950 [Planctomycetaceae bacterium]
MSRESVIQFANTLLRDGGARDLQNAVNDFASSLVDAGQKRGFEFSVEELGEFLSATFFPDGATPESPEYDRRQWASVIQKVLTDLRVSNPDHKMFQTMSFDSTDGGDAHLRELLEQAAKNQAAEDAASPVTKPAQPAVDAFEPEDTYFDATSASADELMEARKRMQAEGEGREQGSKPFWKVW